MTTFEKSKKIVRTLGTARKKYLERRDNGLPLEGYIIKTDVDSDRIKNIIKKINHIELSIHDKRNNGDHDKEEELLISLEKIVSFAYSHFGEILSNMDAENKKRSEKKTERRASLEKSLEVLF